MAADKAMIFKKIHSYDKGFDGFNSRVRGVIVGLEKLVRTLTCSVLSAEMTLR